MNKFSWGPYNPAGYSTFWINFAFYSLHYFEWRDTTTRPEYYKMEHLTLILEYE